MKTSHSLQSNPNLQSQPESSHPEMTKNLQNSDTQEVSHKHAEEYYLLSDEFSRIPFLLYRFWLVLNLVLALIIDAKIIIRVWRSFFDDHSQLIILPFSFDSLVLTSSVPLLYGCCEMLFAITKRNSRIARKSLLKFQYYLICSFWTSPFIMQDGALTPDPLIPNKWLRLFYIVGSPFLHPIGCSAVLRVFKQNHPLARIDPVSNDLNKDFFEQNQVIASEVARHDSQLNTCSFRIYKWWLKFVIVTELIIILDHCLYQIITLALTQYLDKNTFWEIMTLIGLLLLDCLNCYAVFETDTALRVKSLAKTKKAIFLLKISVGISIVMSAAVTKELLLEESMSEWVRYGISFCYCVPIPVVTLIGALKAEKIIDSRDHFAQASSYNGDER